MPGESVKPVISTAVIGGRPASSGVIMCIVRDSVAISGVSGCGGSLLVENSIWSNPCITSAGVGDVPFKVLRVVGRQSKGGYGERRRRGRCW